MWYWFEILIFENLIRICLIRNEGYDLSVFFNLFYNTKKSGNDALEMENILKDVLAMKFPETVLIDPASIEVTGK